MRKIEQKAYAKINLSLDILGRLENGYHIVKMVMQTIDLYDELVFETQDRDCPSMEITLVSDNGEIPCGEDNLIVRAVRRMEAKMDKVAGAIEGDRYEGFDEDVKALEEYYENDWRADFELDEAGGLPKDMKRGVLSEDGLYDVLSSLK